MKFLLIVLAIHFVAELVGDKVKGQKEKEEDGEGRAFHPAEYQLRS